MVRFHLADSSKTERFHPRQQHAEPAGGPHASIARRQAESADVALDFRRASAETAVIIVILLVFGLVLLGLFVLYRRKGSAGLNPLAWIKGRHDPKDSLSRDPSDPTATQERGLEAAGLGYDQKLNDSQQTLVPGGVGPSGAHDLANEPRGLDIEKGLPLDEGIGRQELVAPGQMLQSPRSIQTRSSMALNPRMARVNPLQKDRLPALPMQAYTAGPQQHDERPLPSPGPEANPRDTMLTTMSEDLRPTRHRNVDSWVSNMQDRQARREMHHQLGATDGAGEAADTGSRRWSDASGATGPRTASVGTARLAWAVPQGPAEVEVTARHLSRHVVIHGDERYPPAGEYDDAPAPVEDAERGEADYQGNGYDGDEVGDADGDSRSVPLALEPQSLAAHPRISVQAPSVTSTIPEADYLPTVTRYKHDSGSTLSGSSVASAPMPVEEPAPAPVPVPPRQPTGRRRGGAATSKRGRGGRQTSASPARGNSPQPGPSRGTKKSSRGSKRGRFYAGREE